jgi:hypothetical protein
MIDLHTHSNKSDGSLSPAELVRLACKLGLKALALTDHDTVDGLKEAGKSCRKLKIIFIPGIEFSAEYGKGELHILGLGINKNRKLSNSLKKIKSIRKKRNLEIIKKMNSAGIKTSLRDIKKTAKESASIKLYKNKDIISRPHFAAWLVKKGAAANINDAFEKYLTPGKPFYIQKANLKPEKIFDIINSCGGKAVIAHPLSLNADTAELDRLLSEWKEKGLSGIEAYHPSAKKNDVKILLELAEKHGLAISAGSDFHGLYRQEAKLGYSGKNRKIGDTFLFSFTDTGKK